MMASEKTALRELTEKLKQEGFADIRFYIAKTRKFGLNVLDGEKEKSVRSSESVYFVEAGKDGKRCCTFFNQLDCAEDVVEQMQVSAMASEEDYHPIPAFEKELSYTGEFASLDEREAAETLVKAEQVLRKESKIDSVSDCSCHQYDEEIILMDDNGTTMTDCGHSVSVSLGVVSREDGDTEIAWGGRSAQSLDAIDTEALAQEVAELGAQRLHAKPIASGKYAVILKNDAAAELLEAYLPIFYATEMQNEMSSLAGKEGEMIAISDINLVEDPQFAQGRVHRHFDDEGTPVSKKYLIHAGKFESALYNRKSAGKANCQSSGNGFKSDVQAAVGTGVTNVVFESISSNTLSMEELCQKMGDGLVVTGLEGVFAGVSTITGNFSLLCKGMVVENGKMTKPFCEVTIAGSIYELLKGIVAIGNDPVPTASGSQFVQTPSLLLKGLAVSGL